MSLVVYKSSAGSGKTFTLVKEYIKLVVNNPDNFKHILAITFTNKAATEMKSRILTYLSGMAYGADEKNKKMIALLEAEIMDTSKLTVESIRERAGKVLANILHGYSNFAVSTIDSFVLFLVRSFTRELHLPVNFDVELDQDKLITKSIEMLLGKVGQDQGLTRTLVKFVERKIEEEKSWNVEKELKDFAQILLKESSVEAIEEIKKLNASDYIKISRQLTGLIKKYENDLSEPGVEGMELIKQNMLSAGDFASANSGVYAFFKRFAEKDFSKPEPNKNVEKMLESGNWTSAKCKDAQRITIEGLVSKLTVLLDKATDLAEKLLPDWHLFKLIQQNIFQSALLGEIENVMEEFRENDNVVHISEFNKRISTIINGEPIPFIYERLGEKYYHFMVDEFQDTSMLQWQNLLPLFENSLSGNHFNMIVGDGKQAIYRWRNGEVEQFAALPRIFNKPEGMAAEIREKALMNHYDEQSLNRNYRTRKEVVEFNNAFFEESSRHLPEQLRKIYLAPNAADPEQSLQFQKQEVDQDAIGGSVHVEFLDVEGLKKEDTIPIELLRIHSIIEDLRNDNYQLKEITVLTRTNFDASNVARFLIEHDISVVTSEALRLSASAEVHFVVSVLRFLNDSSDRTVIADIVMYLLEKGGLPIYKIHDILLKTKEIHPGKPELKPLEKIIDEEFGILLNSKNLKSQSLYEIAETLFRIFNLNPKGRDPFARFFMDTILDFTAQNDEAISDFLEFWDDSGFKNSIVVPEETDAVKVMTIHKAKGLEFPVVIYPFANGDDKLGLKEFWVKPEIDALPQLKTALVKTTKSLLETKFADEYLREADKSFLDLLNVLYVAMTRPSERMFLILHDKHNKKGEWKTATNFYDVADLFYQFLQISGEWNAERCIYNFGYEGQRIIENEEIQIVKKGAEFYGVELAKGKWREKATLGFVSSKNWDTESSDEARGQGVMIHNILAKIKTKDDIPGAINEAIIEGVLDEAEKDNLQSEITHIINSPEINQFFDEDKQIINEKEMLLNDGRSLRPDRVVVDAHETAVIDYKTGREESKHKEQLEEYAMELGKMGYKNINKYLIYLHISEGNLHVVNW